MEALEEKLGYRFTNRAFLENALTHSSYANENKAKGLQSNERLEFLGDSVLGFITADYFYRHFSHLPEGKLTKLRAELLQRDLKDAALKKLTDEGFPVGLADLLTYTDQEGMEKSLKHTQEVFKGALEVAVKERLRGKTPEGLGGGAKAENTVKDQIAQGIRGGMM